ncbi:hypothetical protein N0V88_006478 [Collariella sp. IMI 366227]|nr:hypothetical protein N0V88_006478 [Collariella sp. IMI 366227]
MDINSNSRGSHAASKPKHISRLRKEMLQHRVHHNPFSSPPSSTGSHDTVSTTEELSQNLSNFSFSPEGEGTRMFGDDLQQLPAKRKTSRSGRFASKKMPEHILNTSAIARTFPEWSGLVAKDNLTFTQTVDMAKPAAPFSATGAADNTTFEYMTDAKRKRFRDLQARVENESDCSTILSLSPARPASVSRRSRFANLQPDVTSSPEPAKRSLQDLVSKIRTEKQSTSRDTTPRRSPVSRPTHETPAHNMHEHPTRSFFLPAFRHLPDWTSGTLKFSAMKNGVPVFVRSSKGDVRLDQYGKQHADLPAVGITKEDEEIFVSMDKLQEEVRELHDHDAMLQREAERLQREVDQLQAELKRSKSRKLSDSAIGSESDASFRRSGGYNPDMEYEIAQLRSRLDQASRQVSVDDIHSAALVAERDEALHQASVARERATRLQAELEASQKDVESSLHLLQEKETLQLENASLLSEKEKLRDQRDAALQNNKTLTVENDKLRRELSGVQKDLRATREELASVRKQYEAVQGERRRIFKENKKLQAQVAARDQHIADLKKGISSRDRMIDSIQGMASDTAVLELNAELHSEVDRLQQKAEEHAAELDQRGGEISAKEGRIRSLKEQNLDLSIDNERLHEENQRLRIEHDEIRAQWLDERHKVVRLNQLVAGKNATKEQKDDCVRLDDDFKQREAALQEKLDRRQAAVEKVKLLSSKIREIAEKEFTSRITKVTRIVEPKDLQTTADDFTGSIVNIDDDPTQELHLQEDSEDFASFMQGEIGKLKCTVDELQARAQEEAEASDYSLPPTLQRSKSDSNALPPKSANSKGQLPGILKKSSQFALEDTGRFSIRSAMSIASHHSEDEILNTAHSRKSLPSEARPESRLRRSSETGREATEPNMTSAFFMPDITLQGQKQGTAKDLPQSQQQQRVPSLSKDARRVLDGICKHNSTNCNVCVRIAAHGSDNRTAAIPGQNKILITSDDVRRGKKTVSADKPVPVSDREQQQQRPLSAQSKHSSPGNNQDPTIRPSIAPGEALAILIKETQDEIDHLQMELKRLNEVYFALDKALGMRERRRVMADIKRLQGELEARSGHLYRLHDVLEGQKMAGQLMQGEGVDVTVLKQEKKRLSACDEGETLQYDQ